MRLPFSFNPDDLDIRRVNGTGMRQKKQRMTLIQKSMTKPLCGPGGDWRKGERKDKTNNLCEVVFSHDED